MYHICPQAGWRSSHFCKLLVLACFVPPLYAPRQISDNLIVRVGSGQYGDGTRYYSKPACLHLKKLSIGFEDQERVLCQRNNGIAFEFIHISAQRGYLGRSFTLGMSAEAWLDLIG